MVAAVLLVVGGIYLTKHIKDRRQKKRAQKALERGTVEYNEQYEDKADLPPEYDFSHAGGASAASSIYSREQHAV